MWYFNIADCGMLSIFGHAVEKPLKNTNFCNGGPAMTA